MCRVGRAPDADLRLVDQWAGDASVSRRHASILYVDGGFRIVDNESRNGVYVNGHRVQSCWLSTGDEIQIGGFVLRFAVTNGATRPNISGVGNETSATSSQLGPIRLLEKVHASAATDVYKAALQSGQVVALKAMTRGDDWDLHRLRNEFEILTQLSGSDHVVRTLGKARLGTDPAVVLEWRSGGSLRQLIQRSPKVHQDFAVPIFQVLSRCLNTVHSNGYAHNDIKPSNVLLDGTNVPVLSDFGSASRLNKRQGGDITGSIPYMAPERHSTGVSSAATDIFSLGCTFFETLTGALPFGGATEQEIELAKSSGRYESSLLDGIHEHLRRLIDLMVSPDHRRRPDIHEIAATLQSLRK
ncbi:MAG: protein kinase [Armatimonadetes bacterium]|nr:protein kinase [Armatimonadota bacterium]